MRLKILGSAAGGGFPQWNCNYHLSQNAREGIEGIRPRTQSSLAVCDNDRDWVIFNASPDIREQIAATTELHPSRSGPLRSTPISAVVLTNADVDHIAGLLSLRERERFAIYATRRVLAVLEENSVFNVLDRDLVQRRELVLDTVTPVLDRSGRPTGLAIEAFVVPGKIALFLEDEAKAQEGFGTKEGDTIGVRIISQTTGNSAFYIPGCARIDGPLKTRIMQAECLLFDGTCYTDDEMPRSGVGAKTAQRMGHIHISGADGSMALLADSAITRRIYVHINNTNPILDDLSPEAAIVRANGWEVAWDGMEVRL